VLPTAGDIVASNNFTVTIDQNINVGSLTNAATAPAILTAQMTSNTTPSGIVTASSYYGGGYEPFYAFDRNLTGTGWITQYISTGWIAYEFTSAKVVASYQVFPAGPGAPSSVARDWTLEGWNGSTYTVLDTVTGNSGTATVTRSIANTTAYIKYRLNITANNGNGNYTGTSELYLLEANDYGTTSTAGGGFILNSGITINTNITGGTVNTLTYSASGSATINGNLLHGTGGYVVNFTSSVGTLNIVGNVQNNGTSGGGVLANSTGTINIVGNVYSTANLFGNQIAVQANATVNITGNIYNFPTGYYAGVVMINLTSICTLNVVGSVTNFGNNNTSGACIGINAVNCVVNVTGIVTGGPYAGQVAISSGSAHFLRIIGTITSANNGLGPAVYSSSYSAINLFSGPFICNTYGYFPYQVVRMHLISSSSSYIEFRDETTGGSIPPGAVAPATRLISPSTLVSNLAISDVRFGIIYALGTLTGTLRMPVANQVTFGVAVDNTFGNSVLTAASIWDYLIANITTADSIGMRLKNVATPQTTGEQLEAFLRLD
jgi:hypothetical protein